MVDQILLAVDSWSTYFAVMSCNADTHVTLVYDAIYLLAYVVFVKMMTI